MVDRSDGGGRRPGDALAASRRIQQRGRLARVIGDLWPPLATLAALIVFWEVAVVMFRIPRFLVPRPSEVAIMVGDRLGYLVDHGVATGWETLLGFLLSVAVGIPVGIIVVESRLFVRTVYPLIVASQSIPKLAVAPLFVVWFGVGLMPKILIAFLIAFFPIVIDTAVGLRSVPPESMQLARSMGLGSIQTFFKVRMPQALPSTFGGLKIGISLAVVGAVVGEFLGSSNGLGYVLIVANGTLNTPLLFAALLALSVLGIASYGIVALIERLAIPWYFDFRPDEANP